MAELAQPIMRISSICHEFKGHQDSILTVAVFPDRRRMVTSSYDKTLLLWDLKDGVLLKKMEGHSGKVWGLAVSRDGQLIASGDENGELIAWRGGTGESLTQTIKVHSQWITSLDFSPDGTMLATGSFDKSAELWSTKTWQAQGNPITCTAEVGCVRFSPSGELLAIASMEVQILNPRTGECIARFKAAIEGWNRSLAWTPDGTRLLSAGSTPDPTIREWDTSTWKSIGDPWSGHSDQIDALAVNSSGTLAASASYDNHVRLWCLSCRQTIALFKASEQMFAVTFSMDGKYILCGGSDATITQWAVPKTLLEGITREQASLVSFIYFQHRHELISRNEPLSKG